jgi:hypothetical protein
VTAAEAHDRLMKATTRTHHSARLIAAAVAAIAITGACTFEVDDDRAATRRIAERIERSVERHADDGSTIDVGAVNDAVDIVFGAAILDDIADENDLRVTGLADVDGDGRDDDGRFEIGVADATACIEVADRQASFRVEPCAS